MFTREIPWICTTYWWINMKKIWILFLILVSFKAMTQPVAYTKLADGIIAQVGDKIILKSDFEKEIGRMISQNQEVTDSVRGALLYQLMLRKMMVRQAELDSLPMKDEEVEQRLDRKIRYFAQMMGGTEKLEEFYGKSVLEIKEEFKEQEREEILAEKMQEKVTGGVSVSPKEVRAYFQNIPVDSLPLFDAEYEIAQIVLYPQVSDEQRLYTINQLDKIREDVVSGKTRFTTAARLYSQDGSARQGGDLGYFGRGDMVPEFEATAFRLKPLEVSKVVKTDFGYHLIQLIDRKGDRVNCRHILIKPSLLEDDQELARLRLDSIRKELVKGTLTLAQAVKQYSEDEATKGNGGILRNPNTGTNTFTAAELGPEQFFIIEKLKPGEITPVQPLEDRNKQGFRIVMLKSKTKQHQANLQDDYARISAAAIAEKKQKSMDTWMNKNKKTCYITLDPSLQNLPGLTFFTAK